jgi:hypothetical protein
VKSCQLFCSLLLILFCAISCSAQAALPAKALSPLEQTLMAREKSLIAAIRKDDGAFFQRALTEDFSLVGIDGQLQEGRAAMDELGDSGLVELTAYNMKVMAGDSTAIVTYDAIVREAPQEDQGPPPRYRHLSSVWVKQGEQWKLKFHQATAAHWGDW